MYCPNCSADLTGRDNAICWNCRADFTSEDGWKPTDRPQGEFRKILAEAEIIQADAPRRDIEPIGVLHLPIFFMNTVALMHWMDAISNKGVTTFWYITLPFALAYAAIPYFLFVVLPTKSASSRLIVGVSATISIGIALFVISRGYPSMDNLLAKLGFAAQMSIIPCAPLAVLRYIAEKLPQDGKKDGGVHES